MLDGGPPEREHFRPRIGGRGGEVPQERVPRLRNALLSRIARIVTSEWIVLDLGRYPRRMTTHLQGRIALAAPVARHAHGRPG